MIKNKNYSLLSYSDNQVNFESGLFILSVHNKFNTNDLKLLKATLTAIKYSSNLIIFCFEKCRCECYPD